MQLFQILLFVMKKKLWFRCILCTMSVAYLNNESNQYMDRFTKLHSLFSITAVTPENKTLDRRQNNVLFL